MYIISVREKKEGLRNEQRRLSMTKKESELLKVLQQELADAVKKDPVKHSYSVTLRTSDPDYNLTLIPPTEDENIRELKYTIYYGSPGPVYKIPDIDESKTYYCSC